MKTTKSMRIAFGMLALTLITSCFVGGTFAKYTTSGNSVDTARVAKFGVEVKAAASMFAKEYDAADPTKEDVNGEVIAKSVVSSGEDMVVAPGTSGTMVSATLTGTPEVAVEVKYEANVKLENWTAKASADAEAEFYCPIIITVDGKDIYQGAEIDGVTIDTADKFAAAVKSAIEKDTASYQAGTNLANAGIKAPTVTWKWEFEGAAVTGQTDYKDTYLGNEAAADNAGTIEVTVGITVTQID